VYVLKSPWVNEKKKSKGKGSNGGGSSVHSITKPSGARQRSRGRAEGRGNVTGKWVLLKEKKLLPTLPGNKIRKGPRRESTWVGEKATSRYGVGNLVKGDVIWVPPGGATFQWRGNIPKGKQTRLKKNPDDVRLIKTTAILEQSSARIKDAGMRVGRRRISAGGGNTNERLPGRTDPQVRANDTDSGNFEGNDQRWNLKKKGEEERGR